ncbi:hypothetical protein AAMO2058_000094600 [Amorphochlora amoebiformis]
MDEPIPPPLDQADAPEAQMIVEEIEPAGDAPTESPAENSEPENVPGLSQGGNEGGKDGGEKIKLSQKSGGGGGYRVPPGIMRAEEAVRRDKWDLRAWKDILQHGSHPSTPSGWSRIQFEKFLEVFPTSALYWREYIEYEIRQCNFSHVETLFGRCLLECPDIELWKTYIKYIRVVKKGKADEAIEVSKAYEFVLKHLGVDYGAGDVWEEYLEIVKGEKAENSYEIDEKRDRLRKIYQRAICLPIHNVEKLWKDYDVYEHSHDSKTLAATLMSAFHPRYMKAKQEARERSRRFQGIHVYMLAVPPSVDLRPGEDDQLFAWRRYIDFEANVKTTTNDNRRGQNRDTVQGPPLPPCATKKGRVLLAYKQALLCLRYRPELWNEAALYFEKIGDQKTAEGLLDTATTSMPSNFLLGLMHANFCEKQRLFDKATKIHRDLTKNVSAEYRTLAWIHLMRHVRRCAVDDPVLNARKVFLEGRKAKGVSWQLYIENARMECRTNENPAIAKRVLAFAYKKFQDIVEFVDEYTKFLFEHTDAKNLQAVFARALDGRFPVAKCRPIWDRYVQFERECSMDLAKIEAAEEKRNRAFAIFPPLLPSQLLMKGGRGRHNKKASLNPEKRSALTAFDVVDRYISFARLPCTARLFVSLSKASGRGATPLPCLQTTGTSTQVLKAQKGLPLEIHVRSRMTPIAVGKDIKRVTVVIKEKQPSKALPASASHLLVGPGLRNALSLLPTSRLYKGPVVRNMSRLLEVIVKVDITKLRTKVMSGETDGKKETHGKKNGSNKRKKLQKGDAKAEVKKEDRSQKEAKIDPRKVNSNPKPNPNPNPKPNANPNPNQP